MGSCRVLVRPEERDDYPTVHDLIRRAFSRDDEARAPSGFCAALSPAREEGFPAPFLFPGETVMGLDLLPEAFRGTGRTVTYPPAFGICDGSPGP
ncbi:MAG: hypothetical protein M0P22_02490 [Methanoculleus sp.]|nr:hypothetical protein [Methanoculleus sp.]